MLNARGLRSGNQSTLSSILPKTSNHVTITKDTTTQPRILKRLHKRISYDEEDTNRETQNSNPKLPIPHSLFNKDDYTLPNARTLSPLKPSPHVTIEPQPDTNDTTTTTTTSTCRREDLPTHEPLQRESQTQRRQYENYKELNDYEDEDLSSFNYGEGASASLDDIINGMDESHISERIPPDDINDPYMRDTSNFVEMYLENGWTTQSESETVENVRTRTKSKAAKKKGVVSEEGDEDMERAMEMDRLMHEAEDAGMVEDNECDWYGGDEDESDMPGYRLTDQDTEEDYVNSSTPDKPEDLLIKKAHENYQARLKVLEKVPLRDIEVARKASVQWRNIRPPLTLEEEMSNDKPFVFEITSMDYAISNKDEEGLVVRMAGITREGHTTLIKAKGFLPYFYIRKPKEWSLEDADLFLTEFSKSLSKRMEYKYGFHFDPNYALNKKRKEQQKREESRGRNSYIWMRGNSRNRFVDTGFGDLNLLDKIERDLMNEGKPTRTMKNRDDFRENDAAPTPQKPKKRWMEFYEHALRMGGKSSPKLVIRDPNGIAKEISMGYSTYGYEHTPSEFIKITLAYPPLIYEARALLENITGEENPPGPPKENWGEADFLEEEPEDPAMKGKVKTRDGKIYTKRIPKRWLSDKLIEKAGGYLELFDCNIDFCRNFSLNTRVTPETWGRIPAGKYKCVQRHKPTSNFNESNPNVKKEDITRSFYALPPGYDPDIRNEFQRLKSINQDESRNPTIATCDRRESKCQREIVVDYRDISPVFDLLTPDAPLQHPDDVKLKDTHARKVIVFADIETRTGKSGAFSNPLSEDTIAIYASLWVKTPDYSPTDHYVKRDHRTIDKSTTDGVEKVLEDFVFHKGKTKKIHETTFANKVNAYQFDTCAGSLLGFQRFLVETDADEIIFYNGYSFDWPFMMKRADVLGVGDLFHELGRIRGEKAYVEKSSFTTSAFGRMDSMYTRIGMRSQKDPMVLFSKEHKFRSYSQSSMSKSLLNDDKADMDFRLINEMSETPEGMYDIIKYNRKDVHLLARLTFKTEIIIYWLEMAVITQLEVEKLISGGEQARIMSLLYYAGKVEEKARTVNRAGGSLMYHFPASRKGRKYGGAIVQEAEQGYYPPVPNHENQDPASIPTLPPEWDVPTPSPCFEDNLEEAMRNGRESGVPKLNLEDLNLSREEMKELVDSKGVMIDNVYNRKPRSKVKIRPGGAVINLDFTSMYPSIIQAYNICCSTIISRERLDYLITYHAFKHGRDFIVVPNMVYDEARNVMKSIFPENSPIFVTPLHRKALIVSVIHKLLDLRTKYKREMQKFEEGTAGWVLNNKRQLLAKVVCNSCYGMLGVKEGPFACTQGAATVTKAGKFSITKTKAFIHHRYKDSSYPCIPEVIYGDTDSVFCYCPGLTILQALVFGELMSKELSKLHPYPNKLDLEKGYSPLILYKKKRYGGMKYLLNVYFEDGPTGQKIKRYGLKMGKDGYGSVHTTGSEVNRRDKCRLVSKVISRCFEELCKNANTKAAISYPKKYIRKLLMGEIDLSLLIISKKLNKPIHEYEAPTGVKKREDKLADIRKKERAKQAREEKLKQGGRCAAMNGGNKGIKARQGPKLDMFFETTGVGNKRKTSDSHTIDGIDDSVPVSKKAKTSTSPFGSLDSYFTGAKVTHMYDVNDAVKEPEQTEEIKQKGKNNGTRKRKINMDDDEEYRNMIKEELARWNPPGHVATAMRRVVRNPKDRPSSGDRVDYIITSAYDLKKKGTSVSAFCEDPTYAYEAGLRPSVKYYLEQQLMKPIIAFFEPILDHDHMEEFFSPNPKNKNIDASHLKGRVIKHNEGIEKTAFSYMQRLQTCVSCHKAMTPTTVEVKKKVRKGIESVEDLLDAMDEEDMMSKEDRTRGGDGGKHEETTETLTYTKPVCADCSEVATKDAENRTFGQRDKLQAKGANYWATCQKCRGQEEANKEIICTNTNCETLWKRKKLQSDVKKNEETLDRFVNEHRYFVSNMDNVDLSW